MKLALEYQITVMEGNNQSKCKKKETEIKTIENDRYGKGTKKVEYKDYCCFQSRNPTNGMRNSIEEGNTWKHFLK